MEHRSNECSALGPFESVEVGHLGEDCNKLALQLGHGRLVVQGLSATISAERLDIFNARFIGDGFRIPGSACPPSNG